MRPGFGAWARFLGLYNGNQCPVMSGRLRERSLPMDTQTVIALCDVFLVLIGIIGLVLVRRE